MVSIYLTVSFPGIRLCLPSVLLIAVPSTLSYPTPGLLMDIPLRQNWSAILHISQVRGEWPFIVMDLDLDRDLGRQHVRRSAITRPLSTRFGAPTITLLTSC